MYIRLGDTKRICFGTADAGGAAANADSLPTVVVYDAGVAMAYSPPVVNKATGLYEVAIACTTVNGFSNGHAYSVAVVATVGGVIGRDGLSSLNVTIGDV